MSCNGWTNHQTWTISLWYNEIFTDLASDGVDLTPDYMEDLVLETACVPETGLVSDVMHDFFRKVNWQELSDNFNVVTEDA